MNSQPPSQDVISQEQPITAKGKNRFIKAVKLFFIEIVGDIFVAFLKRLLPW
jgi:hypothetical protein